MKRGWLVLFLSVLAAGCGATASEAPLVVMAPGTFYAPGTITVPVGGTVIWRNQDRQTHTVTVEPALLAETFQIEATLPAGAAPLDSGDLAAGHTWAYTFDTPGEYLYFCRYHADDQMIGMVVVEG
jgi:plastocyanin